MKTKLTILAILALFVIACGESTWTPKPRGYNYIALPTHEYQKFDTAGVPYTFEFSKHAKIHDHKGIESKQIIDYKGLGAKIWLTYFPVKNSIDTLEQLIYTTYRLLQKNNVRADAIANDTIITKNGKKATIFYLEGEVPTQYQFYYHDSTSNFIRGALYFETARKNDSLAPVIDYVREDINYMINSLEWK
jgi:gliding motility-associated lipoprotein GldD